MDWLSYLLIHLDERDMTILSVIAGYLVYLAIAMTIVYLFWRRG